MKLVYSELHDSLVFLEKDSAVFYSSVSNAIALAETDKMTWGQLQERFPKEYDFILGCLGWYRSFEDWFKFNEEGYDWDTVEVAKVYFIAIFNRYEDYKPLPEWQFHISEKQREQFVEGVNLSNSQNEILPASIRDAYSYCSSFTERWVINPNVEKDIVAALESLGHQCERNGDLIWDSCNIV
ncbi:MAG: hypothetical protein R6X10_01220 [Desulfobacterales bacterium]